MPKLYLDSDLVKEYLDENWSMYSSQSIAGGLLQLQYSPKGSLRVALMRYGKTPEILFESNVVEDAVNYHNDYLAAAFKAI
jgi:hypothetical protein